MIALGSDKEMSGANPILEYAVDIFKKTKEYCIQRGRELFKIKYPDEDYRFVKEKKLVDMTLEEHFIDDKKYWPGASWQRFIDFLFKKVMVVYNDNTSSVLYRLEEDLKDPGRYMKINLRLLKNQIFREEKSKNVVFGWGLNDQRLCQEPEEDSDQEGSASKSPIKGQKKKKKRKKYLPATMLH